MNICIITGRLVRNPELRQTTTTNKPVASFTVANDYGKTASGDKKTAFIDCVAWNATAEFVAKYFQQGDPIMVSGTMTTRTWERDGQKRKAVELEVRTAEFHLAARRKDEVREARPGEFSELVDDDGELPF